MLDQLLTEKLRPKEIKHMILPHRIRVLFEDKGLNHNVLLVGSPGCGKTTLAKILSRDLPHIFINVSDESSVDTIRTKINDFCSTMSIMDGKSSKKVVVLDEFDGASDQFYKALRGTIEKFAGNTRFIATCNWLNKVPEAIQSRFEVINFDPINQSEEDKIRKEWRDRIKLILAKLNIQIDDASLDEFEKEYFPDLRSSLNRIQTWVIEGVKSIDISRVRDSSWSYDDLYRMIFESKDPVANYQVIVGQYSSKIDDVMTALGEEFINWIIKNKSSHIKIIPGVIVEVAQHQAQRQVVIDPVVSLLSLIFKIQKLVE
jgi:DNA polymerase III delta prime subunit